MQEQMMMAKMRSVLGNSSPQAYVFGVGGSPRRHGNSDVLLTRILEGVQEKGIPETSIHLSDIQFSGCVGCEKCRKDQICTGVEDGMSELYPEVHKAKGLVLVSPTHNYNITSWMKAFIDRLYCFYTFAETRPRAWSSRLAGQGRKAVLAAVCEQEHQADMGFTLDAMRLPLKALGYEIVGELPVFSVFDRGKVKDNEDVLGSARKLGVDLANSLA